MKNQRISLTYGIITGIVLIVYFLILGIIGWNSNPFFSFVNAGICAIAIFLAIKNRSRIDGKKFKYQNGFATGLLTGFYATIIFTIFFGFYYTNNTDFANKLLDKISLNPQEGILIFSVAIMGFASTLVVTLAIMQLFKISRISKKP